MNNYLSQFSGFSGMGNQGFGGGDPIRAKTEQMRTNLANKGIKGVPEASLRNAAAKNVTPFVTDEAGKRYFLKEDTALRDRFMAREIEDARRSKRPVQEMAPSYNYETETGERYKGTFLGNGSYGGFGGGKAQSSQRSWDNYVPFVGPRNPDYIERSGFKSKDLGGKLQPTQPSQGSVNKPSFSAATKVAEPAIPPAFISSNYGYGYTNRRGGVSYNTEQYPRPSMAGAWNNPFSMYGPPPMFPNQLY